MDYTETFDGYTEPVKGAHYKEDRDAAFWNYRPRDEKIYTPYDKNIKVDINNKRKSFNKNFNRNKNII